MPYSRTVRTRNQLLALWKWCSSFRQLDWELNDYPIGITEQDSDPALSPPRFSQHRYRAYIVNWHLSGSGETPQQARADLEQNFETAKRTRRQEGKPPIRPGTNVPIEFAAQDEVSMNPALADDFIQRILSLDWAWISDESTLWDFHIEQTNDLFYAKIRDVYGVDVSDVESGRLWTIFKRIEESRASERK